MKTNPGIWYKVQQGNSSPKLIGENVQNSYFNGTYIKEFKDPKQNDDIIKIQMTYVDNVLHGKMIITFLDNVYYEMEYKFGKENGWEIHKDNSGPFSQYYVKDGHLICRISNSRISEFDNIVCLYYDGRIFGGFHFTKNLTNISFLNTREEILNIYPHFIYNESDFIGYIDGSKYSSMFKKGSFHGNVIFDKDDNVIEISACFINKNIDKNKKWFYRKKYFIKHFDMIEPFIKKYDQFTDIIIDFSF